MTNRSQYIARKERGVCVECASPDRPVIRQNRCEVCARRASKKQGLRVRKARNRVFDHYGRACRMCGNTNPLHLVIDHTNNDGADRRRNASARITYESIIDEGFPDDLQTLCANCNLEKLRKESQSWAYDLGIGAGDP